MLKLNGGLGTSMGLEKAKSLLEVKDGKTFLDLIADQIKYTRSTFGSKVPVAVCTGTACMMVISIHSTSTDGCCHTLNQHRHHMRNHHRHHTAGPHHCSLPPH